MAKRIQKLDVAKLASIEEELRVLKASISQSSPKSKRAKSKDTHRHGLAGLEGAWAGANFTYDEIRKAEYKVK